MEGYLIFLQNIGGIIVRVVSTSLFLFLFFQTKKKVFAWCSVLFAVLCINTILLYMAEFLPGFDVFYKSRVDSEPLLRSSLVVGYLIIYRMIIGCGLNIPLKRGEYVCIGLLVLLVPITWLLPMTKLYNFIYNTITWSYTFYIFGLGIKRCDKIDMEDDGRKKICFFLWIFLALQIFAYVEVLLWLNTGVFYLEEALATGGQRKIATALIGMLQNVLGLWYGFYFLRKELEQKTVPVFNEKQVLDFARGARLTQREQEILLLVLEHKGNQDIAQQLHISVGTVKTHIHNIFTKSEVESRGQLIRMVMEKK